MEEDFELSSPERTYAHDSASEVNDVKLSSPVRAYAYDSDFDDSIDDSDDDELSYGSRCKPKLKPRKVASKARWVEELGMAEVMELKGKWMSTGIIRDGKTLCSIEETVYLAEIGALGVSGANDASLELKDIYGKLAEDKDRYGGSWESFQVYQHLKILGYVVGRPGIPWSLKSTKSKPDVLESLAERETTGDEGMVNKSFITEMFSNFNLSETRPIFDVYPPDHEFKKTCPGSPSFVLFLVSGKPPSNPEIRNLESRYKGSPLKFCHVEHGRVSIMSFTKSELPVLP